MQILQSFFDPFSVGWSCGSADGFYRLELGIFPDVRIKLINDVAVRSEDRNHHCFRNTRLRAERSKTVPQTVEPIDNHLSFSAGNFDVGFHSGTFDDAHHVNIDKIIAYGFSLCVYRQITFCLVGRDIGVDTPFFCLLQYTDKRFCDGNR